MTIAAILVAWFALSIPLGLLIGRIIANADRHSHGENREAEPVREGAGTINHKPEVPHV